MRMRIRILPFSLMRIRMRITVPYLIISSQLFLLLSPYCLSSSLLHDFPFLNFHQFYFICLNHLVLFFLSILPLIPSYLTFILLFIIPKHINIFNSITQGLLNTPLPPCYQYCKPCGLLASVEVAVGPQANHL